MSYGSIEGSGPARRPQRTIVLVASAMALSAAAVLTALTLKGTSTAVSLEQFALVPMQQLKLGDDQSKNLPVERHWETEGWPTMVKCPGAWCDVEPYRNPSYPNNKAAFTGDPKFPLAWGPCNIAIQDC